MHLHKQKEEDQNSDLRPPTISSMDKIISVPIKDEFKELEKFDAPSNFNKYLL